MISNPDLLKLRKFLREEDFPQIQIMEHKIDEMQKQLLSMHDILIEIYVFIKSEIPENIEKINQYSKDLRIISDRLNKSDITL